MWNQNNFSSLAQCIEGNSWTPLTTTRYPDLRSQIRHDHLVLLYPSKERIGLVFWNGLEEDFLLKIIHYFHSNASTAVAGNKSKRFYYYYYYCYFIAILSYYCPFALFCCLFLLSLFNQCRWNYKQYSSTRMARIQPCTSKSNIVVEMTFARVKL